jgi:hypothetical protein
MPDPPVHRVPVAGKTTVEAKGKVNLSALQQVGVWGVVLVGCLGGVVILALVTRWMWIAPVPPSIPVGSDEKIIKLALDNYKILRDLAWEDTTRMLDAFVTKLLLPIFASFVGYVFGSQHGKKSDV